MSLSRRKRLLLFDPSCRASPAFLSSLRRAPLLHRAPPRLSRDRLSKLPLMTVSQLQDSKEREEEKEKRKRKERERGRHRSKALVLCQRQPRPACSLSLFATSPSVVSLRSRLSESRSDGEPREATRSFCPVLPGARREQRHTPRSLPALSPLSLKRKENSPSPHRKTPPP